MYGLNEFQSARYKFIRMELGDQLSLFCFPSTSIPLHMRNLGGFLIFSLDILREVAFFDVFGTKTPLLVEDYQSPSIYLHNISD